MLLNIFRGRMLLRNIFRTYFGTSWISSTPWVHRILRSKIYSAAEYFLYQGLKYIRHHAVEYFHVHNIFGTWYIKTLNISGAEYIGWYLPKSQHIQEHRVLSKSDIFTCFGAPFTPRFGNFVVWMRRGYLVRILLYKILTYTMY